VAAKLSCVITVNVRWGPDAAGVATGESGEGMLVGAGGGGKGEDGRVGGADVGGASVGVGSRAQPASNTLAMAITTIA
jgi:hypothetical protein